MCRPGWDIVAEKQAVDDEYDPDEDEESEEEINKCGNGSCMCDKAVSERPEWKWVISKSGLEHVKHLMKEIWKRDQDSHGQYHYNDFNGYGFQEIMENEVNFRDLESLEFADSMQLAALDKFSHGQGCSCSVGSH